MPIAEQLLIDKEKFPMTIIYMKLDFCGKAYKLFDHVFGKHQYVDNDNISRRSRLFNQFHSPSTADMKNEILEEIKLENSNIRVLFATTALGMGVDAPNIRHVIHISPPSSLECYVQEFGRAGRTNIDSFATLYFNNSDISKKTHVEDSMRKFCLTDSCLRTILGEYFGFSCLIQERCCSNCNPELTFKLSLEDKKRTIDMSCAERLSKEIDQCLNRYKTNDNFFLDTDNPTLPTSNVIIENVEDIFTEEDLLFKCDILQIECRWEILDIFEHYAPL